MPTGRSNSKNKGREGIRIGKKMKEGGDGNKTNEEKFKKKGKGKME